MSVSARAGKAAEPSDLANVPRLVTAYYALRPDPAVPAQRVAFWTSGHRGAALDTALGAYQRRPSRRRLDPDLDRRRPAKRRLSAATFGERSPL
jgi:hypothetical protein